MAQVSQQHVTPLTGGFVGILAISVILLGVLNYLADK